MEWWEWEWCEWCGARDISEFAHMEPIWVPAGDLRVQGIVVGLMRRY